MPTVRTTMQPDKEIEVDDAEFLDLQRQRLLVEQPAPDEEPTPQTAAGAPVTTPAAAVPKKTTAGGAGSKES